MVPTTTGGSGRPSGAYPFTHRVTVRFHETDPAGIVFFGDVFRYAHVAYEEFVQHLGIAWKDWFENERFAVPIRKSECEYFRPLAPPHTYSVSVAIDTIGDSSFTARYTIQTDKGDVACVAQVVHMFMEKASRNKMAIPSDVRGRLETYQRQGL